MMNDAAMDNDMAMGSQSMQAGLTPKRRRVLAAVSAVVVGLAFQAILSARGDHSLLHPEITAIELVGALVASFAALAFDQRLEERGVAWAASYFPPREGLLFRVLSILPSVAGRAALITALLSIPNATFIPTVLFREEALFAPVAVVVRFLADIPQAVVLCLLIRLALEWRWRRVDSQG